MGYPGIPIATIGLRRALVPVIASLSLLLHACGDGSSGEPLPPPVAAPAPAAGLSLLAGNIGGAGFLDGQGSDARFYGPNALAATPGGEIYVADAAPLRKVAADGTVTTLGGNFWVNYGGKDGPLSEAEFYTPNSIALAPGGVVFLVDYSGLHRITPDGMATLVYGARGAFGTVLRTVAADSAGNAFVAEGGKVVKVTPQGATSTFALSDEPGSFKDIASDPSDNLYVIEARWDGNRIVRKITPSGALGVLDTGPVALEDPSRIAADAQGNVYVVDKARVRKITPAGAVTTVQLGVEGQRFTDEHPPEDLTLDAAGNLYLADAVGHTIVKVTPAGVSTNLAGLPGANGRVDGTGAAAQFDRTSWLAKDASGNFYTPIYEYMTGFAVRKITPEGVASTQAFPGTGSDAGVRDERLFDLAGFAMDGQRNFYLLSGRHYWGEGFWSGGAAIHRVTPAGAMDLFAGNGEPGTADGVGTAARFSTSLGGAAVDGAGNLYVGDGNAIRKITPSGTVTTVARGFMETRLGVDNFISGLAIDAAGNLYAACSDDSVRKITPAGAVSVVTQSTTRPAGRDAFGPAIAVDDAGNIYAGTYDTVRKITPAGEVSTIAGVPGHRGIRLGSLPGYISGPGGMVYTGDRTLVMTSGGAVLKLVVP